MCEEAQTWKEQSIGTCWTCGRREALSDSSPLWRIAWSNCSRTASENLALILCQSLRVSMDMRGISSRDSASSIVVCWCASIRPTICPARRDLIFEAPDRYERTDQLLCLFPHHNDTLTCHNLHETNHAYCRLYRRNCNSPSFRRSL